MKLLDGKICIITGGGRGIGKATAEKFTEEGARIIIAENEHAFLGKFLLILGKFLFQLERAVDSDGFRVCLGWF